MHMPVIFSAREATATIHAWTKLHAQIMSWFLAFISAVYVRQLPEARQPQLRAVCCWRSVAVQTTSNWCENFSSLRFRLPMLHSMVHARCSVKVALVILTFYCACVEWYSTCMMFAWYTLGGTVCTTIWRCSWSNGYGLVLQLGLELELGTGNGYFIPFCLFCYLKRSLFALALAGCWHAIGCSLVVLVSYV